MFLLLRVFRGMPFPVKVHWTNGPAIQELLVSVQDLGLDVTGPPGKGWAVWQGLGVACRDAEVVGLFDADIRTFGLSYPERMLRPLLDPSHGMAYVKAFYSRLSLETQALQGRATRLFVGPLLASLEQVFGPLPYLRYLRSFRYPLAGVCVQHGSGHEPADPSDWGLRLASFLRSTDMWLRVASRKSTLACLITNTRAWSSADRRAATDGRRIFCTVLRGLMEHEGCGLDGSPSNP